MSLVDTAIVFFGGYVVVIIIAAFVMTVSGGRGSDGASVGEATAPVLRQQTGAMPPKPWGFRPPVKHSHYEPAPWQVSPPQSDESAIDNVERATDIKRELGSEHPPWERLDRRGL